MLPAPPMNALARVSGEVGLSDGFGADDLGFWVGVVGGVIAACVGLLTLLGRMLAPIREANKHAERREAKFDQLFVTVYGLEADPEIGRTERTPGLVDDVREIKSAVARLLPNGGSSIADQIRRIEEQQARADADVRHILRVLGGRPIKEKE